jgi:pimeloyl-ACP methyl ester carboxylesterase
MSRPHSFTPPAVATARTLTTSRGPFAAIEACPEPQGLGPAPAVLLLPGFTGSKEDFNALLEPLVLAGYRAVAVDGRGQFESEGPEDESAYTREELAADVLAQAAAVAGPGGAPVHLLGHSHGGQTARTAVLSDARPFLSLTLMSSGPALISPSQRKRAQMLIDALAGHSKEEVWALMRAMEPLEETPVDGEDLHRRWLGTSTAQLTAAAGQLISEPDRVAELAAVSPPLPVHVLSGERDDTWSVPLLDDMARRLGAARTVIEGAEHSPNTDRPKETAAALVAFWDKHPGPRE